MKLYAHAVVAEAQHARTDFVLGSMLPDLAAMAGMRVKKTAAAELLEGMRLHHASDVAFHTCEAFCSLTRRGVRESSVPGCARCGRAAAHVGIELLLDGRLVAERPPSPVYRSALERAASCAETVCWQRPDAEAWRRLCTRISSPAATSGYRDPDEVAYRTARTLARRPRLALADRELAALAHWLHGSRARVAHHGPSLIAAAVPEPRTRSGAPRSPLHFARPDRGEST